MHAVVTKVTVHEGEAATEYLRGEIVPRVSQAPGFVAGYWIRLEEGNQGTSVLVFESEDAARGMAGQIEGPPSGAATIDNVTVGEVVANA
jgi:hypothetical protein